ncbi:MAG: hypothetical protein IKJ77_00615 [Firmicutes bacterium]|nr:hypothetical protein [Bacillota bacterium]
MKIIEVKQSVFADNNRDADLQSGSWHRQKHGMSNLAKNQGEIDLKKFSSRDMIVCEHAAQYDKKEGMKHERCTT